MLSLLQRHICVDVGRLFLALTAGRSNPSLPQEFTRAPKGSVDLFLAGFSGGVRLQLFLWSALLQHGTGVSARGLPNYPALEQQKQCNRDGGPTQKRGVLL